MKEALNRYLQPTIEKREDTQTWCIVTRQKDNGSTVWLPFTTEEDAKNALMFARQCQRNGIALLVDRKIMIKKNK